jgi:hypothetical protein
MVQQVAILWTGFPWLLHCFQNQSKGWCAPVPVYNKSLAWHSQTFWNQTHEQGMGWLEEPVSNSHKKHTAQLLEQPHRGLELHDKTVALNPLHTTT